uniref:EF-hand domain-containing protein n=1 Tax=Spongospora subterranea TaxID=70186 RepID=A0A0H5QUI2_9EUKA|eukprot:CRZ05668.1 hypothetical protein [Spongospora subterranea]
MQRSLIYKDIVVDDPPLQGIPKPYVPKPLQPHTGLEINYDAYDDPSQLRAFLANISSGADVDQNRLNVRAGGTIVGVPSIESLLPLVQDGTLHQVLQGLPLSILNNIYKEISDRQLESSYCDIHNIPELVINRVEAGDEELLQPIMMSMHSYGDASSPSPFAAVAIKDYIGDLMRRIVAVMPRPLTIDKLMSLFPLQTPAFQHWWSAKQEAKNVGQQVAHQDMASSSEDVDSDFDNEIALEPASSSTPNLPSNIEEYFDLTNNGRFSRSPLLYEITAPSSFSDGLVFGPKTRLNFNMLREKSMSMSEYNFYSKCRQASLVGIKTRPVFIRWIGLDSKALFPASGSVRNKIVSFLGFIAHDHIGAIIELARSVHDPSSDNQLTYWEVCDAVQALRSMKSTVGPVSSF